MAKKLDQDKYINNNTLTKPIPRVRISNKEVDLATKTKRWKGGVNRFLETVVIETRNGLEERL